MIGTRAALRYAKAAVQKAIEDGQLDALAKDMETVYDTVQNNRDLEAVLQSPIISSDLKHNTLQAVFTQCSDAGKNLLRLVAENNRRTTLMVLRLRLKSYTKTIWGWLKQLPQQQCPSLPN